MFVVESNSVCGRKVVATFALFLALSLPVSLLGEKKKKEKAPPAPPAPAVDYSRIQFPPLPDLARVRYATSFYGEKLVAKPQDTKKAGWMDKMAGTAEDNRKGERKLPPQLLTPLGVAVDSKGFLYVADQKVGGIFIFNTETGETRYIRNGGQTHFVLLNGIVIDDTDRLFVADGNLHHVLVFDADHKLVDGISQDMVNPFGMAVDNENRFLYVVDQGIDQVLVYDLDSFKLLRKIGTTGHKHELTSPGDFGQPHSAAVDHDGNLYVTDMLNCRVEVFDADGNFVRTWGKNNDGPGNFGRPKGIAVDSDGHIWVVDQLLDRVSIFDNQGDLLIGFGGHGKLPSQFKALVGIAIDKNNRVFTLEDYPNGRVQQFRYTTEAEAKVEYDRRQAEREKKAAGRRGGSASPAPAPTSSKPAPQGSADTGPAPK
jgi:sugar lactone lactonase YvrE